MIYFDVTNFIICVLIVCYCVFYFAALYLPKDLKDVFIFSVLCLDSEETRNLDFRAFLRLLFSRGLPLYKFISKCIERNLLSYILNKAFEVFKKLLFFYFENSEIP